MMTKPRRYFPLKLSRCGRTGLALWLGVGLLVALMVWLPVKRDQKQQENMVMGEKDTPASEAGTEQMPHEGIIRTSTR
jgi:hypothetical protein